MPWSSQVVLAELVIIQGTTGGLFVYNGAPGTGTLIASITPPGVTADPYGNAVDGGGLAIYGSAGASIFLGYVAGPAELEFRSGAAFEATPANVASGTVGSGASESMELLLSGPQGNTAGAKDWAQIIFASNNDGGTSKAEGRLIWVDTSGTAHIAAAWGSYGFFLNNGSAPAGNAGGVQLWAESSVLKLADNAGTIWTAGQQTVYQGAQNGYGATTATPVTGLAVTLQPGIVYRVTLRYWGTCSSVSGVTYTPGLSFSGTLTTAALSGWNWLAGAAGAITQSSFQDIVSLSGFPASPASAGVSRSVATEIHGYLEPATAGTLKGTVLSSVSGDQVHLSASCMLSVEPVGT